jgi:hypothetical protein
MPKERGEIGAKSARVKGILCFWATIRRQGPIPRAIGAGKLSGPYGVLGAALDCPLGWRRTECSV